jgi:hypothetical protein
MKEIYLDPTTNDIEIVAGGIPLNDNELDSVRQRLYITLNAWMGEWVLNIDFGIPYRQNIFVAGATKDVVDAIFLGKVNEFEEIVEILEFESTLDKLTRKYEIERLVARTEDGQVVNINLRNPDEYTYTYIPPAEYSLCQ